MSKGLFFAALTTIFSQTSTVYGICFFVVRQMQERHLMVERKVYHDSKYVHKCLKWFSLCLSCPNTWKLTKAKVKLRKVDTSRLVRMMTCRCVWNKQQPPALFRVIEWFRSIPPWHQTIATTQNKAMWKTAGHAVWAKRMIYWVNGSLLQYCNCMRHFSVHSLGENEGARQILMSFDCNLDMGLKL